MSTTGLGRHLERGLTVAPLEVPGNAAAILEHDVNIKIMATQVAQARDVLFLEGGSLCPVAMRAF